MIVEREWLDNYNSGLDKIGEDGKEKLLKLLESVDWDRPVAEVRDQLIMVMEATCASSADASARVSADFYNGMRERAIGEPMDVVIDSKRAPGATDGAVRAFVQDLVDGKGPDAVVEKCISRLGYETRRAAGECMRENAVRNPKHPRYARVPSGIDTGDFCIMLASRGPVYRSEESAGMLEHFHDNCQCTIVPMWKNKRVITDVGGVIYRSGTQIEGYDPDALFDEYLNMQSVEFSQRMAKAAELAHMRHPENDRSGGRSGRPSKLTRDAILSDALKSGEAHFHSLYEMGETISAAKTYDELFHIIEDINKELALHFPTDAEYKVLLDRMRSRRKQILGK